MRRRPTPVPLLSLSRVDFDFGREALLRDVTLDLEPGEKAALVGINGSGKSTLLQIVAGTLAPDSGERHLQRRARVVVLPQETAADGDGTLLEWVKASHEVEDGRGGRSTRCTRGSTPANPRAGGAGRLRRPAASLRDAGRLRARRRRSSRRCTGSGFRDEDFTKPIRCCRAASGGGRRSRRRCLQGGDLVLLDEPTNHLDLDALEWLQDFV